MRTALLAGIAATAGVAVALLWSGEIKAPGATAAKADGPLPQISAEPRAAVLHKVVKTDAEWRRQLSPEQYRITRGKDTEAAFCGAFHDQKEPGIYSCVCCGLPLFTSGAKFKSGTGWPSFFMPITPEVVATQADTSLGMRRTEILCVRCDAHLGHVFDDGPKPTGLRYCLNSASLAFMPTDEATVAAVQGRVLDKAIFAAGCFWGVEAFLQEAKGVVATQVGYTGGHLANPTYEDVCSHKTGHAEAVEVLFDPAQVSYADLLKLFWGNHDPTSRDRQGPDVGSQYRSAVFACTPEQRELATAMKAELDASGRYRKPVQTAVVPATAFYRAEEYHQHYVKKHGGPNCHSTP